MEICTLSPCDAARLSFVATATATGTALCAYVQRVLEGDPPHEE